MTLRTGATEKMKILIKKKIVKSKHKLNQKVAFFCLRKNPQKVAFFLLKKIRQIDVTVPWKVS